MLFRSHRVILPNGHVDLPQLPQIFVIAIGKAAHAMTSGLIAILPPGTTVTGVVTAPTPPETPVPRFEYFVGGHPIPNSDSWRSAEAILRLLATCDERSVVFFLLSGGGSALVERPLDPETTLKDIQQVNQALVTCGAPIHAMNTVRRHLSAIKGGRLALAAGPATKITIAVTDVPMGNEAALARSEERRVGKEC